MIVPVTEKKYLLKRSANQRSNTNIIMCFILFNSEFPRARLRLSECKVTIKSVKKQTK